MHMPDRMTGPCDRVEVITSVQRRRRWTPEEKIRMVEETYLPGNSVSLVARQHGIASNQLFTWRRLMAQGALAAATAGEEVVPASDYRALEAQVRELQRLLGKKTMENELLREAVSRAAGPKKSCCARPRGRRVDGERGCRRDRRLSPTPVGDAASR
jgi:transposase